ncbi:MAG: hypothetical protein HY072_06570, partial [Deltaproteobacteria bacterium]|nr:hypothetical protein [Deltaproteobacteria bacterium]
SVWTHLQVRNLHRGNGNRSLVYLDYHGIELEGEVKNPGEFYFQRKAEEKFDSLVKRRKNFHKEMLRDVVLSK